MLIPAISWGDFTPQNPKFPPEKHPKHTKKHYKMHQIYHPNMCFPHRTWSLELTLFFMQGQVFRSRTVVDAMHQHTIWILFWSESQCSSIMTGSTESLFVRFRMSLAAECWTRTRGASITSGKLARIELQLSSLERTRAWTKVFTEPEYFFCV